MLTVNGTGFRPSVSVGVCQAIADTSPSQNDCGGPIFIPQSDASGDFSQNYKAQHLMFVPSLSRVVDCAAESCVIGAAEVNDIANTATFAPITFSPFQPDGRIVSLINGAVTGDNIYNSTGTGQTRIRTIAPGASAPFSLQIQNDATVTDDITVTGPAGVSPFTVRYLLGYYDVTADVTGSGLTFTGMAPHDIVNLAVSITAAANAPNGAQFNVPVTSTSAGGPATDTVVVGASVQSPS